jgi:RHS repeat-associated protein
MSFAYDANGRNVKVTSTGVPDALTVYDALGNRVATKVNDIWQYMVYDAFGKLVAEYGQLSDGLGGVKYVQQDWQGSVRTVTNANGFAVARTDHEAFGGEIGYGVGQRSIEQGYSADKVARQGYGLTENDDGSGQQHTWFRKLETEAGRWSSPDPYKGSMRLGDPQSFNRYSYVGSDPVNFVDPSGLLPVTCDISQGWQGCMAMLAHSGQGIGFWGGSVTGGTRGPGTPPTSSIDPNQPTVFDGIWFYPATYNPPFGGFGGLGGRDRANDDGSKTDCEIFVNLIVSNVEYRRNWRTAKVATGTYFGVQTTKYLSMDKVAVTGFIGKLIAGGQDSDVYRHITGGAASILLDGVGLVSGADSLRQDIQIWRGARAEEAQASKEGNRAGETVGSLIAQRIEGALTALDLRNKIFDAICEKSQ